MEPVIHPHLCDATILSMKAVQQTKNVAKTINLGQVFTASPDHLTGSENTLMQTPLVEDDGEA